MSPSQYLRSVPSKIWEAGPFAALPPVQRDVAMYCLTGPQTLPTGCFSFSMTLAATHLGLSRASFAHRLAKVRAAMGWCYDEATTVLWLPEWSADHLPTNVPVAKHWRGHFDRVPDCAVKTEAIATVYRLLLAVADDGQKLAAAFGKLEEDEPRAYPRAMPGP